MNYIEQYLVRHNFSTSITGAPHPDLKICVVIPAYDEPSLIESLESLWKCERPCSAVEIIVVANAPEIIIDTGRDTIHRVSTSQTMYQEACTWARQHHEPEFIFHIIDKLSLPAKDAGVGLARKIGMDEAVYRLHIASNEGIIAGFDADAVCDTNYLVALENHFEKHKKSPGASVYFEHPLNSVETRLIASLQNDGILHYELHLRYLIRALRYAQYPFAYHTVGSSFAVRSDAYVKQGGMNKRKAGEDFYFLQKIITLGNFTEINNTRVIPSSRLSDRVPFGTGAAMRRWAEEKVLTTYNLEAYKALANVTENIGLLFTANESAVKEFLKALPEPLQCFFEKIFFIENHFEIQHNSASLPSFRNRFYRWFDAFQVIKYLNYSHESFYPKNTVGVEAKKLLDLLNIPNDGALNTMLSIYRKLDREGSFCRGHGIWW